MKMKHVKTFEGFVDKVTDFVGLTNHSEEEKMNQQKKQRNEEQFDILIGKIKNSFDQVEKVKPNIVPITTDKMENVISTYKFNIGGYNFIIDEVGDGIVVECKSQIEVGSQLHEYLYKKGFSRSRYRNLNKKYDYVFRYRNNSVFYDLILKDLIGFKDVVNGNYDSL
jgi:hypothetical protein